ncbi:transporter [Streptomyces sp. NPDC004237]|uniref:sodium:solute symporter family transporter n=1 Tax=Streptomyces sp. NPDC004237 TaxID=3154455 RepID=UPI0033A2E685
MKFDLLSAALLNPVGSGARRSVIFALLLFIAASLLWVFTLAAAEDNNPEKLYLADRSLSPVFNGFAMAGEQITVISLLAVCGSISLFGYDAFTYAVDSLIALGILVLFAQKIRNSGQYTLAGLFSLRAPGPKPRIAATAVTLTIAIPVLMVQLRTAGISTALLIGTTSDAAEVLCTVLVGCLVACFATVAGLRGTSFMHVAKVVITFATLAVLALLTLRRFEWSPAKVVAAAVEQSTSPGNYLSPGLWRYSGTFGPLNSFGTHIVLVLGTAMMPHIILRVSASRNGRTARRSVSIATALVGIFVLLLIVTGFSAAAVVGGANIGGLDVSGQSALIQLASSLLRADSMGQIVLITAMAAVVFFVILTAVTSVTFAAAVSLAHDVFASGSRRRGDSAELRVLRLTAAVVCVVGLSLAAATHRYPAEFLTTFSLSVAASCICPALVYSFFWAKFNGRGLLWSVYGGLLLCVVLQASSSTVSGSSFALWPGAHFNWYPFQTPGIVSVPAAFFLGWLGSVSGREGSEVDFRSFERKLLTGVETSPQAADASRQE